MKNNELELNILSCLLLKPELMENNKLEDKYFKNQRLWRFMKAFYNKFKTFDTALMISVASNQYKMADYIAMLFEYEPTVGNFDKYLERLKEQYEESKKDRWIINKCYNLANELVVGSISVQNYQEEIKKVYESSEKIFKE